MKIINLKRYRSRFFWKLFVGHALLITGSLFVCAWLIIGAVDNFYQRELTGHLRGYATLLVNQTDDLLEGQHLEALDAMAKTNPVEGLRITFIKADGQVLGDTLADPRSMESHANREEVLAAVDAGFGESTRWSDTVNQQMKYVALPVMRGDTILGVVRVSMPLRSIAARMQLTRALIWRISGVALFAAVVLALGLALIWSRRIARVTFAARSIARGDLSNEVIVGGTDEIALLARAVNRMRGSLAAQLGVIDRQRRTLEYMLTRLDEGVVVVDSEGVVILANPAAWKLLQLPEPERSSDALLGRGDLPDGVRGLLATTHDGQTQRKVERRITLGEGESQVILLARVSNISLPHFTQPGNAAKTQDGRILVLTDITELTRAIQIKADFVANASHELRTPLSAIRAAIETLISIEGYPNSSDERPLLEIIDRHSERLGMMVADLLDLSWLESGTTRVSPKRIDPANILVDLEARFRDRIEAQALRWQPTIEYDGSEILADRKLLTMVLDNLIDNAIKFTPEGGTIAITGSSVENGFSFVVADTGVGIPPEDQARIFERFYQVERARSGVKRGTGLGMAIVRHAVEQMGGSVKLESAVNEGTTIRVFIPASPPPVVGLAEPIYISSDTDPSEA